MEVFNEEDYWNERATYFGRVKLVLGGYGLLMGRKRILDFGCSDGETTREIFENVGDDCLVYGIDRELGKDCFERRRNDSPLFFLGDGFSYFQERGEVFDLVLAMNNVLYKMTDFNRSRIMDSLGSLVDEDGYLILATDYSRYASGSLSGGYVALRKTGSGLVGDVRNSCALRKKVMIHEIDRSYWKDCSDIYKNAKKNLDSIIKEYFS